MNGLIKSNSIGLFKQSIKINSTLVKRVLPISTTIISSTPSSIYNNNNNSQQIRNYYDNNNEYNNKNKYVNNNNNEWVKGSHFFKTTNELSQSEAYQYFNKRLIDQQTNEINFIRFKEMIDSNSNDTTINYLFGWCTKVIKTKDVNILESFLFYFRKVKSTEFLKVLAYINQNDIPQNIFIFNITLFYYSEMNMIEEAKRLTDLLLSMGSSLPEKAYLAILKTFSTDIEIIKGIEKRIKTDKELGIAPQLYNELIIAYINGHRDLNSALPLLEKLEESNSPVYQSTVITLLNFFLNNNMPDRSINLLINVSDKYPSWFAGQSFCEKVSFTCYSLITKLPTLFEHMEKKKTISKVFFNSLIQISSEKSNKEAVIMIYNYMIKHYAPDARTLKDLIYISVKDNNLQECLYWYNTMLELKYTLNSKIASYLIRFFIRAKHFQPIPDIIELARKDRTICSPLTVGIMIYYISYIANSLPGTSIATSESNKELLKEFYAYIKQQQPAYREEVTDCIIQHCLMEDRLEEAERWFYLKEKQYNIAPSRDTFTNFMAYHIVRSEFKQWNYWKHKMSQYIHTSSNASASDTIVEYFRRYYSNPKIGTNLDDRKTNWFQSSIDYVVESKNNGKNNGNDDVGEQRIAPPNKSSEIINLVESKKLDMAFAMLYDVVNKNQPIKKNVFGILLNSAIKSNKHQHVKRLYQLFVINSSLMPSFETTLSHLDLIYRTSKSDDYQQYVFNPPHGVIPSDFAIANIVILGKYSIKKCIATLSNPENRAYLSNDHVRNGFLYGLIKVKDFNRASRLITSMFDKCPDIYIDPSNLKLYLEKIVEHEYNSPLVNVIINYFQSNRVQFDSRTVNFALASNAYLTGNYTEAYNKISIELYNATWLDASNINFAIKVYAKHYPIPPNHNFKQWQTLQTLAEKFKIPINATYSQLFKCLHDDGRYHIIRKLINDGEIHHYFSLPQDAFYYMLHSYKNIPEKLLALATRALRKDYQIHDNRSKELIKDAHKLQPSTSTRIIEYLRTCDKYTHDPSTNDLITFSDQELEFIDHKIIKLNLSQNINYLNK